MTETSSISMTFSPDLNSRFDLESRTGQKMVTTSTTFFPLSFGTKFKVKLSKKLQLCPLSPVTQHQRDSLTHEEICMQKILSRRLLPNAGKH